jgi:AbrB family looped-hinge helix DNA binding protein
MADGKGRHIFGTVKAGERGQIVISKKAREIFHIKSGDMLLVLGDEEQGIAIVKDELFKKFAKAILEAKDVSEEELSA